MSSKRPLTSLAALGFILAAGSPLLAQADVGSIGGLGSNGCQGGANPPTLSDGTVATGTLSYSYDHVSQNLTLVVSNTSPVTVGVQNPIITHIYGNLPYLAVSAVTLVSQTGSGGAAPAFALNVDVDNRDGNNNVTFGCFGAFGFSLTRPNIHGGISNPAADTIGAPPGSWVIGPATFVLHIDGPGVSTLTNTAFSHSLSVNPPGSMRTTGAFKFQAGAQGGSGTIGTTTSCAAGGWMVGEPRIGNTVTFVESGGTGCYGCLVFSTTPGPTISGGVTLPVGSPFYAIISTYFLAPNEIVTVPVTIPNDQQYVGLTLYFAVGLVDQATLSHFSIADQFTSTILP